MKTTVIRPETPQDFRTVEDLTREAFWNVYRPGCTEHCVLHRYRSLPEFVPELSLILEVAGQIVGHIMYSRGEVICDDGRKLPILIFGPVSIAPSFQRRGYGSLLIRESLERAGAMGCGAVAITGNPEYYARFGFSDGKQKGVYYGGLPRTEDTPFFLVKELTEGFLDGVTGSYFDPPGYFVSDEDVDKFDAQFPAKIREKRPGQLE